MKKVSLLALMLFVSFVSNSQTTDTSYSKGSNFVGGTHGYLVVFCGMTF
jgi:hypothetical protein